MTSPESRRVLIVDDTEDVRFMVPLQLRLPEVSFVDAASGEQALEACAAERFDALILDYRMPGLSGLDVAKRLKEDGYPAPIVIYSAYVDAEVASEAAQLDIQVVDKADHRRLRAIVQSFVGLPVPA